VRVRDRVRACIRSSVLIFFVGGAGFCSLNDLVRVRVRVRVMARAWAWARVRGLGG
jgi:hypothetical protein